MKLIIEKADNGYILTGNEDCNMNKVKDVYLDSPEETANMLWGVLEYFGEIGKIEDKERVSIEIKHGEDFKCNGCEICREKDL